MAETDPALSSQLTGNLAKNVSHSHPVVRPLGVATRATSDREAVHGFLNRYRESRHTFIAYRRECDRLLAWLDWNSLTLNSLAVEDIPVFRAWLSSPEPASMWCSSTLGNARRISRFLPDGEPNPDWRLFVRGLSDRARDQAMRIIGTLFSYLQDIGYITANPVRAAKTGIQQPFQTTVERYFDVPTWTVLLDYLDQLPRPTPRAEQRYHRARFIFHFLFLMGLRREEFVKARSKDLRIIDGKPWLDVNGKGRRKRLVPLNDVCLAVLGEYRASLGLPRWPAYSEDLPLLQSLSGQGQGVAVAGLHEAVKRVLRQAAASTADLGIAATLARASTHWCRHSCASHQAAAGVDLMLIRDSLGHASLKTTEIYLHTELSARHTGSQAHKLRPKTPA